MTLSLWLFGGEGVWSLTTDWSGSPSHRNSLKKLKKSDEKLQKLNLKSRKIKLQIYKRLRDSSSSSCLQAEPRLVLQYSLCACVFRGPSVKRSSGMERSQSSTWDTSDENRNKLVKAASTSKLLAKVVKNTERYRRIAHVQYTQRVRAVQTLFCGLSGLRVFILTN